MLWFLLWQSYVWEAIKFLSCSSSQPLFISISLDNFQVMTCFWLFNFLIHNKYKKRSDCWRVNVSLFYHKSVPNIKLKELALILSQTNYTHSLVFSLTKIPASFQESKFNCYIFCITCLTQAKGHSWRFRNFCFVLFEMQMLLVE